MEFDNISKINFNIRSRKFDPTFARHRVIEDTAKIKINKLKNLKRQQ
jgi:hypothetical protein